MNWRVKPTINTIATFKGFKDNEHWNIGEQDTIKSLSIKSFIKTKNPRHFFLNNSMQVAIFCFEKFIFICSQFEFNAIPDDYEAGVTCVTDFVSGEEDSR